MGFDLGSIIGGSLGTVFKDIVGSLKLDPAKKAEFQAALAENEQILKIKEAEFQAKLLETQTREIEVASANIRAEATSGDKYTSRSRPSFMYMMLALMLCNYVIFPIINRQVIEYPEALFWLFGSCMLGYTGARTWEKIGLPKGK